MNPGAARAIRLRPTLCVKKIVPQLRETDNPAVCCGREGQAGRARLAPGGTTGTSGTPSVPRVPWPLVSACSSAASRQALRPFISASPSMIAFARHANRLASKSASVTELERDASSMSMKIVHHNDRWMEPSLRWSMMTGYSSFCASLRLCLSQSS